MKKALLAALISTTFNSFSQTDPNALFKHHDYLDALKKYQTQYNQNKTDVDLNYKIAECYLNTNIDKTKAIPYLEFVVKQPKHDAKAVTELGRAYHYNNQFDQAIECYKKGLEKADKKEKERLNRFIDMAENGKKFVAEPLNVEFQNLGKEVNSPNPEYYPFIPSDESFVAFTSRRGGAKEFDGYFASDIFISEVKNGVYTKAKSAGAGINTAEDEQIVGLTPDGKTMLIYIDHTQSFGDIFKATKAPKGGFGATSPLSTSINTPSLETSASINMDNNVLVFASNRPGGLGGTDIYVGKVLPSGEWGDAQNIGAVINTKYNEDFPQLTEDGKTLYFCSEGHNSMGGFDIFRSTYNDFAKTWSEPVNIGYPINTSYDDMHYAVSATQREAYVSQLRPEGLGDLDIYRVIFKDVEERMTFIKGCIYLEDSLHPALDDIEMIVIDKKTMQPIDGIFLYKAAKHKFSLALPPGHYLVEINLPGFAKHSEEIDLLDKSDFKAEGKRSIIMHKQVVKPPSDKGGTSKPVPAKK